MKGLTGFFIAVERVLVYPMNDPFLTGHLFLPAWSSYLPPTQPLSRVGALLLTGKVAITANGSVNLTLSSYVRPLNRR